MDKTVDLAKNVKNSLCFDTTKPYIVGSTDLWCFRKLFAKSSTQLWNLELPPLWDTAQLLVHFKYPGHLSQPYEIKFDIIDWSRVTDHFASVSASSSYGVFTICCCFRKYQKDNLYYYTLLYPTTLSEDLISPKSL